jgi:glycosyltransferase involved in cell wall biosynthesis
MKLFFLFFFFLGSTLDAAPKTICLNMIVKDESAVIKRCLDSVKPLIDSWVIVDLGSVDGTQAVIKECLKDIPGELYEKPLKGPEENCNEALQLAKGKADYILFMGGEDWIEFDSTFQLPALSEDVYCKDRTQKWGNRRL